jgi:hypothetical protein
MLANHGGWAVGIVKVETPRIVPRLANKIRRSIAVIFLILRTSGRNQIWAWAFVSSWALSGWTCKIENNKSFGENRRPIQRE